MHRNLKLENIYVDQSLNIKLFDFGYASHSNATRLSSTRGTVPYMAPEIISRLVYDGRKSDVFSVGVILFIMMQGIFPFTAASPGDQYFNCLINKDYEKYWGGLNCSHTSVDLKHLLQGMLSLDPSDRPSLNELKQSIWIN